MLLFTQFVYGIGCGVGFCVTFKCFYYLECIFSDEEDVEDKAE
jgi:hypothetical protein